MTGLLDNVQRDVESEARPAAGGRQALRPVWVLTGAIALAVLSWAAVVGRWPLAVWVLLAIACILVIAVAGLSTMMWRSVVVAPLAVCILAVGNPVAAHALTTFAERELGPVSVTADRGIVFWELYPGIAGWDAPSPLPAVDTTGLARNAQASIRKVVTELTEAYAYTWTVQPDARAGVSAIPNGFGGTSMFVRVDVPEWVAEGFDGSSTQRDAILAAAAGAAADLQLAEVVDLSGDVETTDGVRTWVSSGQSLTLSIDGSRVSLGFTAGPFFSDAYLPEEYERALGSFEGLTAPEIREVPALPATP